MIKALGNWIYRGGVMELAFHVLKKKRLVRGKGSQPPVSEGMQVAARVWELTSGQSKVTKEHEK